jgi:putative spermidine/putrescine transport system permease protein
LTCAWWWALTGASSSSASSTTFAPAAELEAMQTNATTPVIYALGTMTTALSLVVIGTSLLAVLLVRRRRARYGSDAGQAV